MVCEQQKQHRSSSVSQSVSQSVTQGSLQALSGLSYHVDHIGMNMVSDDVLKRPEVVARVEPPNVGADCIDQRDRADGEVASTVHHIRAHHPIAERKAKNRPATAHRVVIHAVRRRAEAHRHLGPLGPGALPGGRRQGELSREGKTCGVGVAGAGSVELWIIFCLRIGDHLGRRLLPRRREVLLDGLLRCKASGSERSKAVSLF